jgi:molybdenum cofactor synthesis domain-containing protein
MSAPAPKRLTVSLVIIGNEVLSGKVEEENASFLIRRFKALGARVREVAFVEDEVSAICEALERVRQRSDHVLTTGGIGPTHDDVTLAAVARTLEVPIVESPEILKLLERHAGGEIPSGMRRLSRMPEGADLVTCERIPWPVIRASNLWLFPGVPPLLRALFSGLEGHFGGSPQRHSTSLELTVEESFICERLDALVLRHPIVEIGSYPRREEGVWQLRLTFDGHDDATVAAAQRDAATEFAAYLR